MLESLMQLKNLSGVEETHDADTQDQGTSGDQREESRLERYRFSDRHDERGFDVSQETTFNEHFEKEDPERRYDWHR
jgi:hypothetical protein